MSVILGAFRLGVIKYKYNNKLNYIFFLLLYKRCKKKRNFYISKKKHFDLDLLRLNLSVIYKL